MRLFVTFQNRTSDLELLVKIAGRARDVHAAWNVALAIFNAFYHAGGLSARGTVGALGGIHDLLAVSRFCDFRHSFLLNSQRLAHSQPRALKVSADFGSKTCDSIGQPARRVRHQAD